MSADKSRKKNESLDGWIALLPLSKTLTWFNSWSLYR